MQDNPKRTDNINSGQLNGTNVRDNVSRETLNADKSNVDNAKVKVSMENVSEEKSNPSMKELYKSFRSNGLSVIDSWYNAAYLKCSDNYYSSGVGVKNKYKNVHSHPISWVFGNATKVWKHNKWSLAIKLLEAPAMISLAMHKVKGSAAKFIDRFSKKAESRGTIKNNIYGLLSAICLAGTALIGAFWWSDSVENSMKTPTLQLYINGSYAGDINSINEVSLAKKAIENDITNSLGKSYLIGCDISYTATRASDNELLTEPKLRKLFHDTAHDNMMQGYCLYKGDLPICAVEDKETLEQCINESISIRFPELVQDNNVQNIEYKDFIIKQGTYPNDMFVNEQQLRFLLSLPPKQDKNGNVAESSDNSTAGSLTVDDTLLNAGEQSIGTSSDIGSTTTTAADGTTSVTIPIEAIITRTETVTEILPYDTEFIYDDNIPEGLTTSVSPGRNGEKISTYTVDYIDGKETNRTLIKEEITIEPVKAVRKMGTRPLTEEEKQYKSTATYIYPSQGTITSPYGWRVLGGQNEFHKGLDMMSDKGLDIIAADGGVIIQAEDRNNGYGLCILIQHDDGTITRYAHCDELYVAETQKVKQGQLIAKMGATGYVTGVHLHFEIIKDGATVNPQDYLIPR